MRPGDTVRFIHSKGEGIVRRIIDSKNIEVEIEEGFLVPFLKSELVVVHTEESILSGKSKEDDYSEGSVSLKGNLFLAFVPFNDKIFSLYLINDTTEEVLFTVGQEQEDSYKGITSGILKNGTSLKFGEVSISDFESWPEWIIQSLFFRPGSTYLREPLSKKIRIKARTFFKNKQTIPVLQKEGHLFKLEASTSSVNVNPLSVVDNMFKPSEEKPKISRPSKEIDLHIEELTSDHVKMSNSEKLKLQVQTFEKNLENAVASEMDEIIFIHGVGNGVLRQEIHKSLSKNKSIKFFQDARKEKFGYGATLVRIK